MTPCIVFLLTAVLIVGSASTPLRIVQAPRTPEGHVGDELRSPLHENILASLFIRRAGAAEYTKLEKMLLEAVLQFKSRMTMPQPDVGLPTLDPFDFTAGKAIPINNDFMSINGTLISFKSTGVSNLEVDLLSLYLVERVGALDLTLTNVTAEFVIDAPPGSWLSPLKIPLYDQIRVKLSSPTIRIGVRNQVSVSTGHLRMQSTKITLDLGKWEFQIGGKATGTCSQNEGMCPLFLALARKLAPQLIKDWMPVVEKYVTEKLDEKLQSLNFSDLIPPQ